VYYDIGRCMPQLTWDWGNPLKNLIAQSSHTFGTAVSVLGLNNYTPSPYYFEYLEEHGIVPQNPDHPSGPLGDAVSQDACWTPDLADLTQYLNYTEVPSGVQGFGYVYFSPGYYSQPELLGIDPVGYENSWVWADYEIQSFTWTADDDGYGNTVYHANDGSGDIVFPSSGGFRIDNSFLPQSSSDYFTLEEIIGQNYQQPDYAMPIVHFQADYMSGPEYSDESFDQRWSYYGWETYGSDVQGPLYNQAVESESLYYVNVYRDELGFITGIMKCYLLATPADFNEWLYEMPTPWPYPHDAQDWFEASEPADCFSYYSYTPLAQYLDEDDWGGILVAYMDHY